MLVVTDLTRFKNSDDVCMALLDSESCTCCRPLPYVNRSFVNRNNIRPGTIVDADVTPKEGAALPHVEDCIFDNTVWLERSEEADFQDLLERSAVDSVAEAFEGRITPSNRCVPADSPCSKSIVTVRVEPFKTALSVVDSGGEQKLRLSFTDRSGERFKFTPISDLFFHAEALRYVQQGCLEEFNTALAGAEVVYIRVGLSRLYESKGGKQGYWMQANGIYSFPGCFFQG